MNDIVQPTITHIQNILKGDFKDYPLRPYYNFYRDLEGLPLLGVDQQVNPSLHYWYSDMIRKYHDEEGNLR